MVASRDCPSTPKKQANWLLSRGGWKDMKSYTLHEGGTHISKLANSICFHCNVILLQLLLDLIDALRDILGLKREKGRKLNTCFANIPKIHYFRAMFHSCDQDMPKYFKCLCWNATWLLGRGKGFHAIYGDPTGLSKGRDIQRRFLPLKVFEKGVGDGWLGINSGAWPLTQWPLTQDLKGLAETTTGMSGKGAIKAPWSCFVPRLYNNSTTWIWISLPSVLKSLGLLSSLQASTWKH